MQTNKKNKIIAIVLMIYLIIPIFFTLIYSVSVSWQNTLLPTGLTLDHYIQLLTTPRYFLALGRTIFAATLSIVISFILLVPVIYVGKVHFKWMDKVMAFITLLPFALQGVILAVGLIKIYSSGPLIISGTIYILTGAYFVVILPYMYQGIKNSMDSLDVDTLIQAASLLGASESYAFFKVVLPNLLKGVTVSTLLSFAILIGEFVLSNILVGGNYETVQVYMYWSRGVSGHYSSAIIISYFVFVVLISGVVLYINELEAKKG